MDDNIIFGDYLKTYDPRLTEVHSDSSDFDFDQPIVHKEPKKRTKKNHGRIPERPIKNQYINPYDYDEYPVKLKRKRTKLLCVTKGVQVSTTKIYPNQNKREHKSLKLSNNQPEPVQSRISVFRHRLLPRLSSIFRRAQAKHDIMTIIDENKVKNDEYDYNHCRNCERRRIKQFYKRQNYAVQPVYTIQGNAHKAPDPTIAEPLKYNRKKCKNQYSGCSMSSTSESETQLSEKMKQKTMQMRNRFKAEIMKEHLKYQQRQRFKIRKHQYPSNDHKSSPLQVFSSPYQQSRVNLSPSDSQYASELPHSSSGFWEYLFDKINRKYQVQKVEMPKPCNCSNSSDQTPCSPSNCENYELKQDLSFCKGRQQSSMGNSCSCAVSRPEPTTSKCCQKDDSIESFPTLSAPLPRNSLTLKIKPMNETKIQCKCYGKADKLPKVSPKGPPKLSKAPTLGGGIRLPSHLDVTTKPCQEGHDNLTAALAEKYNGEILCIHNPPCILINGCLNLPPAKDPQQPMNFWPVAEKSVKAFSFNSKKKASKSSTQKWEQACQYHVPYVEVRQCQTPEYKVEKKIQSICHHNPPCEVVRGCCKPKFDPRLQNSCVHVPMCQKVPECLIGTSAEGRMSCEHRPRCQDIPLCSRNYTTLIAKESFGTQVKPKSHLVCRHVPPCMMIPKCLSRAVYESYLPYGSMPQCLHQPICETIPACFRKSAKDMVSVSSQYPNSCRIV